MNCSEPHTLHDLVDLGCSLIAFIRPLRSRFTQAHAQCVLVVTEPISGADDGLAGLSTVSGVLVVMGFSRRCSLRCWLA